MFLKELYPPGFIERIVRIEPVFERAVFLLYLFDLPCVINRSIDFQTVADDACVGKQAFDVGFVKRGDSVNVEIF